MDLQLVHASAEAVPLPDASFDVAFCDHGALSWADPYAVVPEAARLVRPGGLLTISITSPIAALCWHPETNVIEPQLHHPYFRVHRQEHRDGSVNYQLNYSAWVRLLRDNGFVVEDLLEPPRPEGATSTYWEPHEWSWAERWPSDSIWKARKGGA